MISYIHVLFLQKLCVNMSEMITPGGFTDPVTPVDVPNDEVDGEASQAQPIKLAIKQIQTQRNKKVRTHV